MAKTVTARVTSETTSTDVATGNGVVDADTQRVVLATDQPAVTVTGTVTATIGEISGDVAHDAADSGKPVKIGGYASAAAPTNVSADGDRVNAWFLRNGAQAVALTDGNGARGFLVNTAAGYTSLPIVGSVLHDDTDGGDPPPVKIGGYASAAAPTNVSADGDIVNSWHLRNGAQATVLTDGFGGLAAVDAANGALIVQDTDGSGNTSAHVLSDGDAKATASLDTSFARLMGFNGATYDRLRSDTTNGLDVDVTRTVAPTASTATLTNVSGSAASVTLLASNTGRKGATIWNDSTAILYVKFGTTASTTSCTVKMIADAYYEVPFGYTGRIDGIWASATGAARITELT